MAMRRPRIKPVANIQLNSKRKPKSTNDVKTVKSGESDVNGQQEVEKQQNVLLNKKNENAQTEQVSNSNENTEEVRVDTAVDTTANINNLIDKNENNGIGTEQLSQNVENETEQLNNKPIDKNENNAIGTDQLSQKNENEKDQLVQNIEKISENENNERSNEVAENTTEVNKVNECTAKEHLKSNNDEVTDALNDSEAFKCPPKVGIQRAISHTSNSGVDDVFYSDIEENALQMDLEKSPLHNSPMSPSKNITRQRIRPTPHFGQRRNSFVGSSPSPHTSGNEDNTTNVNNEFVQPTQTRRERHHSASFSTINHSTSSHHHYYHHTPHKYLPSGISHGSMGRIRTESGCSVFSDTNTSSHKSRKTDDSKQNSRKDFEARFHNGVPEKSAIKMSDLIYYNPATNPMEQKPNPSVKLESEASTNDVKPFTEKIEKDTDSSADGEAIPVPQLKLNAKGELILDDKSLVIETTAEQEARKVLANSSLIYLDENTGMNGFYSRQKRTREWLPSETIKFYRCLQNVGTDFSLMVSLFPNRTRRDLKLKFKKEERKNGNLINKALLYPKQFDLESLKEQIEEEEKLREEQAQKTKILKEKAKESKKRKICTSSVSNRILLNEDIYQNENDQKPKKARKSNIKKTSSETTSNNEIGEQSLETEQNGETNNNNDVEKKPKQKRAYKKSNNSATKTIDGQISENIINGELTQTDENVEVDKIKRRRRRTPNKTQKEEIIIIKEEIIKIENKQDSNQNIPITTQTEYQDTKQLQTEIDELLDSDAVDIQYNNNNNNNNHHHNHHTSYETPVTNMFPVATQVPLYTEHIHNSSTCSMSYTPTYIQDNYVQNDGDINKYEHRTFVNLDDGSVNVYSKLEDDSNYNTTNSSTLPPPPSQIPNLHSPNNRSQTPTIPPTPSAPVEYLLNNEEIPNYETISNTTPNTNIIPEPEIINNDTCSSVISERELNEEDIQSILTELADGSLVLVSSLDPDDPDKVLNEIYMVDKNTGELCDEPLNIPDNIVQCILTVVS